jgi:hypothetical protein
MSVSMRNAKLPLLLITVMNVWSGHKLISIIAMIVVFVVWEKGTDCSTVRNVKPVFTYLPKIPMFALFYQRNFNLVPYAWKQHTPLNGGV